MGARVRSIGGDPGRIQEDDARSRAIGPVRRGRRGSEGRAVLASDDSSYIQGSEIVVDGGITGSSLGAPVYR